jgi:hypothetical protein
MKCVLAPSVLGRGFEHRSRQSTDYKIKIVVASFQTRSIKKKVKLSVVA